MIEAAKPRRADVEHVEATSSPHAPQLCIVQDPALSKQLGHKPHIDQWLLCPLGDPSRSGQSWSRGHVRTLLVASVNIALAAAGYPIWNGLASEQHLL
ncbi:hypothetical protein RRG08_057187 [Elysia crispata]|uniref:Uncharacterized protein n=1 Tax=Elysia crispata TaxID=231223 RepID=A0AAE0XWC3_9GAST|nr:hypothetical protein RRG08_057187 [Elysia crispata]